MHYLYRGTYTYLVIAAVCVLPPGYVCAEPETLNAAGLVAVTKGGGGTSTALALAGGVSTGGTSKIGASMSSLLSSCPSRMYPWDAGVINVRRLGAKGDGKTDDTAAFQLALSDADLPPRVIGRQGVIRVVYVPDGVYKISETLHWRSSHQRYMVLQGQSRTGTIIKLADGSPAFGNAKAPKAVLYTLRSKPDLRDSFRNSIYDLTIDVGKSNPGAVGIDYMSNNTGGIGNVTVRSSDPDGVGAVGLRFTQEMVGPALIRNAEVKGFDVGVDAANAFSSIVFEHLTLSNQRKVGIRNDQLILTIRNLVSINSVPVIDNRSEAGFVQIIGGSLTAESAADTAIRSQGGLLHLRDISISGYGTTIRDKGRVIRASQIDEYTTNPFRGSGRGTLKLPIAETPEVPCDDLSQWVNIESKGAVSEDGGKIPYEGGWIDKGDDSEAIQAAIDAGQTTVYFPNGIWQIGRTIHIRGKVRRLVLMHSTLQISATLANSGHPVFRLEDGAAPVVVLEQFETDYGKIAGNFIEHASSRTLVLRQVAINAEPSLAYTTAGGAKGDVFFEDVSMAPIVIKGQRAWFRQINPERSSAVHLRNDGGQVWVLGMKTEGVATIVETLNGGKTELLGGLLASTNWVPTDLPGIVNRNSAVSVVAATDIDPAAQQHLVVRELKGGKAHELRSKQFSHRAGRVLQRWDGTVVVANSIDTAAQRDLAVRKVRKWRKTKELQSEEFGYSAAQKRRRWDGTRGPTGSFWVYSSP